MALVPQASQSSAHRGARMRGQQSKAPEAAPTVSRRGAIKRLEANSSSSGAPTPSSQTAPAGLGATNSQPSGVDSIQLAVTSLASLSVTSTALARRAPKRC